MRFHRAVTGSITVLCISSNLAASFQGNDNRHDDPPARPARYEQTHYQTSAVTASQLSGWSYREFLHNL